MIRNVTASPAVTTGVPEAGTPLIAKTLFAAWPLTSVNDCELPSETVLAVGARFAKASTSAVVVAMSVITSPWTTSAPGRGVCRYWSSTRARNLIVPRVPGPEGSGSGSGPPVPPGGIAAPSRSPSALLRRAASWLDTSNTTSVVPFPGSFTVTVTFAGANGAAVYDSDCWV